MLKCKTLLRLSFLVAALACLSGQARANQNAQGWCESGAQPVVTSGLISSTQVQASFPACTVTIFVHGGGLATIFADNAGTPLSNPFTASSNGRWIFYAGNGRYDVQLSGAGFPSPVTYSDISLSDPANQQAAVPCSTLSFSATPAFLATNNICYNMTLTGNITSSTITGTPSNGNILLLNFTQDGTGGRSFVFPPSFIIPSGTVFSTAPNTTNYLAFKFDGTNWSFFTNTGTSSGGSPAVGPLGTLQASNGTGGFATSAIVDNGTTVAISRPTTLNSGTLNGSYGGSPTLSLTGNEQIKPGASDSVMYASVNGNDSNDGLSWGSAKLTIFGAMVALPGGNGTTTAGSGTIYVGPNTKAHPTTGVGIWFMGGGDPNYASPPAGWVKYVSGSIELIGVGATTPGILVGDVPYVPIVAGSSADRNHPSLWLSGAQGIFKPKNIAFVGSQRPVVLGECSNNSRTTVACQVFGFIFDGNKAVVTRVDGNSGPTIDLPQVTAVRISNSTLVGTAGSVTPLVDNEANILQGTSTNNPGSVSAENLQMFYGGIKVLGNGQGALFTHNIDEYGDFVHPMPPVIWYTVWSALSAGAHWNTTRQDPVAVQFIIRIDTTCQFCPGPTVIGGFETNSIQGPATTFLNSPYYSSQAVNQTILSGKNGIINNYLFGESNLARRISGFVPVRFTNRAFGTPALYTSAGNTITLSQTDPFGGTGAVKVHTALAGGQNLLLSSSVAYTPANGDWIVGGFWARQQTPFVNQVVQGINLSTGTATIGVTKSQGGPDQGDGEWQWIYVAKKVTANSAATTVQLIASFNSFNDIFVYGPILDIIPAAQISDDEALWFAQSMNTHDPACLVGTICNTPGHNMQMAGGTEIEFLNGANFVGLKAPASLSSNLVWALPNTDSTGTQCLSSNGSLQFSFSACSAGTGTPGGANTQVQFNNSGSFGGSSNLIWVSPKLTIGSAGIATGQLALSGATSGTVTITPQTIAGSPTLTLPNTTGTFASNATAPITLDAAAGTIACATCVTSAAALTANQLVIGGALQASSTLGTLGTTTTVLHGNAGGAPTFAAVNLATETTGITAIANGGTGQATQTLGFDALSPTTIRGDIIVRGASNNIRLALGPNGNCLTSNGTDAAWGSCAAGAIGGSGTTSQVAFFSSPTAITSNANWTYASGSGQTLVQGANAADAFVMSRFTDTAPTGNFLNLKTAGGTTVFKVDVSGNATGTSFTGGGAGPSYLDLPQTSAPPFGTNSIRIFAPTSVPTPYEITLPGASATGFIRATNSSNVNTWTFVAASGTGACASTVVTAVNDNAAPTCNPVTGSMFGSQSQNLVFASPNGSAGNPTFRALVSADLPAINLNVGGGGGVTGTLPIANGGTNATTALTAFNNLSPLTAAGDILYGGASGSGTRLAAGTSSQLLHSGTTPSWSAVSLTAEVSGILPIANGGTNASSGLTNTNGAVYSDGTKLVSTATGGAGTLCLVSVSGGTPAFGSCAGSSSTVWSSLTNPVADLSLAMGVNNSLFTSGVLTGTRNAWEFVDGNSTSTGSMIFTHTGASSTMKPFTATAQGTANGVQMDTAGNLGVIGTGHITSDKLSRTLTTTSPLTIGGGASADLTADRTLACATCVTSGSALTTNAIVIGSGGGQGTASLANGAAGTILTGGTPPSYIDLPDVKTLLAAVCINGTAAPGWSTTAATPTATCRAGTNNKDAYLLWGASDVAYAKLHLPADWDSGTNPYLSMDMASTDATNGHTIIMQVATICAKGDGTTTDDVAFNTAQSLSTITLNGNANRSWTATLNNFTMTGCAANSILFLKFSRTTDTATNVEIYQATVTIPRKIVVQAN